MRRDGSRGDGLRDLLKDRSEVSKHRGLSPLLAGEDEWSATALGEHVPACGSLCGFGDACGCAEGAEAPGAIDGTESAACSTRLTYPFEMPRCRSPVL